MKYLITFLLLLLNFSSCSCQEDYGKISDDIMFQTAKQLHDEKNLCFAGFGGARMYDIEKLNLSLTSYEAVNIDQARKLIIYCANKFLDNVNNSEKVRPFLHNYPFTANNIEFGIFFHTSNDDLPIPEPYITCLSCSKGKIRYYTRKTTDDLMKVTHSETFEEALEIVNNEKSSSE